MSRLAVQKTYKLVIGGQFPRTESGRYLPLRHGETLVANICQASRKDAREAVRPPEPPGPAGPPRPPITGDRFCTAWRRSWSSAAEFPHELTLLGASDQEATLEVRRASTGGLVRWWADKYSAVAGTINPVAASYFNFTLPEPTGVVALASPARRPCSGVSLLAPAIVSGNAVDWWRRGEPLCAVTFGEVCATSDLPGGVVNVLTGVQSELLPVLAAHMDVNALVYAASDPAEFKAAQEAGVHNVKRVIGRELSGAKAWQSAAAQRLDWIEDTLEMRKQSGTRSAVPMSAARSVQIERSPFDLHGIIPRAEFPKLWIDPVFPPAQLGRRRWLAGPLSVLRRSRSGSAGGHREACRRRSA